MAVWSELPNDIWCIIAEKLETTADRIGFRCVSRTWRSLLPFPQPPWLMLAEDNNTPDTRGFFGLVQNQPPDQDDRVYQFELPEIYHTRSVGSTGTWLITVDCEERIRLLNPFSRLQVDLPSQHTFQYRLNYVGIDLSTVERRRDGFVKKVVLSSPPSSPSCIAMAIHHEINKLAFARPGDASWTTVEVEIPRGFRALFQDVIFYKNQFYAINIYRMLAVCHLEETHPKATLLTDYRKELNSHINQIYYLVEWMGELLLALKIIDDNCPVHEDPDPNEIYYKLNRFEVYKFNFTQIEWHALKDLGDYSLFLGFNTSIAVLASKYPGLKKNCIYFTDDYRWGYLGSGIPGGRCMGVFDLEDNSIGVHYRGTSTSSYSPPLWIVPDGPW